MKNQKYIIAAAVFCVLSLGAYATASKTHADDASASVPALGASDNSEGGSVPSLAPTVTGPTITGANVDESAGTGVPTTGGTQGDNNPSLNPPNPGSNGTVGGLVPSNPGSNDTTGGLVANIGGSNYDETSTSTTGTTTPPGDSTSTSTSPDQSLSGGYGGSYYGGGSSGGSSLTVSTGANSSCPLITDYMKLGWVNDPVQVSKLQAFLKDEEGLDVAVTGVYDQATVNAVSAFQAKYKDTVLGAWNAAGPTGQVYITTLKQINKIACATPLNLTADELAIIAAYKASEAGQGATVQVSTGSAAPAGAVNGSSTDATASASTSDQTSNTAAVGNLSILGRLWAFIKNLF